MSEDNKATTTATCDRCGRPAEITVGDQHFCGDCYQIAGSCCLEFGGDDLWEDEDEETPLEKKRSSRGDQ